MTTEIDDGNWLTNFLDNIWIQFAMATGITVFWLIWIVYEILLKDVPV